MAASARILALECGPVGSLCRVAASARIPALAVETLARWELAVETLARWEPMSHMARRLPCS